MTWPEFKCLSVSTHVHVLLTRGIYLARRWEEDTEFSLYYVANSGRGFFAELTYDAARNSLQLTAGGTKGTVLDAYLPGVMLPALDCLP